MLNWFDPALLLSIYALGCCAFSLGVSYAPGKAGVGCLFALFFFESICYPVRPPRFRLSELSLNIVPHFQVIFTIATKSLGRHTKKGSGLIVMVSWHRWHRAPRGKF